MLTVTSISSRAPGRLPAPWILGLQAWSYRPPPHPSSWPSLPHSPAPSANLGPEEGPRVWTGGGFCVRQAMSAEAQGWGVSSARTAPGRLGRPQPAPHPDTWPSSAPASWAPPVTVGGTSARLCDCPCQPSRGQSCYRPPAALQVLPPGGWSQAANCAQRPQDLLPEAEQGLRTCPLGSGRCCGAGSPGDGTGSRASRPRPF